MINDGLKGRTTKFQLWTRKGSGAEKNRHESGYQSYFSLDTAFKKHEEAVMVTLTLPHIFPLVITINDNENTYFVLLQDFILSRLKAVMLAWIRKTWKNNKIDVFTAFEYHKDYNLHFHLLIFGIPYIIPWNTKFGREKEEIFTYFIKKYNIKLSPDIEQKLKDRQLETKDKILLSKYIFTAILDIWLQKILVKASLVLSLNSLEIYLEYKKKTRIEGPISNVQRVTTRGWNDKLTNDIDAENHTRDYKGNFPPNR